MSKCKGIFKNTQKPCTSKGSEKEEHHPDYCGRHQNQAPNAEQFDGNTQNNETKSLKQNQQFNMEPLREKGQVGIIDLIEKEQDQAKKSYSNDKKILFIIAGLAITASISIILGFDEQFRKKIEDIYYNEIETHRSKLQENLIKDKNTKEEQLTELISLKKKNNQYQKKIIKIKQKIKQIIEERDIKTKKIIRKEIKPSFKNIIFNKDFTKAFIKIKVFDYFWYKNNQLEEDTVFSKIAKENNGFLQSHIKMANDLNSGWAFARNGKTFYFNGQQWNEKSNISLILQETNNINIAFSDNAQQGWILSEKIISPQLKLFKLDNEILIEVNQPQVITFLSENLTFDFELFLDKSGKNGFILKKQTITNGTSIENIYLDEVLIFNQKKWHIEKIDLSLPIFLIKNENKSYTLTTDNHLISFTGQTFLDISAEKGVQKINTYKNKVIKNLTGAFFIANKKDALLILASYSQKAFKLKIANSITNPKTKKLFISKDKGLEYYLKGMTYIIDFVYTDNLREISLITSKDENLVFQGTWFKDNKKNYSLSNQRITKHYLNSDFSKGLAISKNNIIFTLNKKQRWVAIKKTDSSSPEGLDFCLFKQKFIPLFCKDKNENFYLYNNKKIKKWEKISFIFISKKAQKIIKIVKELENKLIEKYKILSNTEVLDHKTIKDIKNHIVKIKKIKNNILEKSAELKVVNRRLIKEDEKDMIRLKGFYRGLAIVTTLSLVVYLMQILLNAMRQQKKQENFYALTLISVQASNGNTLLFNQFIKTLSKEQKDRDKSDKAEHIYFKTLEIFRDTLKSIANIFKSGKK